ncbi:MAG: exodeoxyribonuclease VII large subunit [Paracoccaceae bacterium]
MDLIDDPDPGINHPEFSVSEISGAIKRVIEGEFSHVRIKGEIGRVSFPRSGHVYLDLKDERAVLSAVIWKGVATHLQVRPEEGLEVVATGRITTFGGQSKYQLVIEDLKPAGLGALMAMLEKRKAMLAAEGLFDASRKKSIPFLPEVIGVVTSPSGAVIRDILHRLRDRFPRKVLIWPVAVQGDKCAPEVARAIAGFNALTAGGAVPRPDVLIVARGGGSLEDLWGFNEEIVARAAASSDIPLISAVGHETDTTLIDFVSDLRAPTPTAAAELAVPVRHELAATLNEYGARMARALSTTLERRRQRVEDLSRALPKPEALFAYERQKLDHLSESLPKALMTRIQKSRMRLSDVGAVLRPAMVQSKYQHAKDQLDHLWPRLPKALHRSSVHHRGDFEKLSRRFVSNLVTRKVRESQEAFEQSARSLRRAAGMDMSKRQDQLAALERLRETLGYKATLNRGYAVVRSGDQVVTSLKDAKSADALEIEFRDGRFDLSGKPRPSGKPKGGGSSEQGSLF